MKKIVIMKCALRLFCATTASHSSIALGHAIKNGLYTTIGNGHHSGWTAVIPTTFLKAEVAPKEDNGDGLILDSRSDSFQLPEFGRNHHGRQALSRN
ncbi:hypothetical protein AVEN_54530-1 [Araneus ventricosus]|uniref:Uncharacterized protein n=1 Tax=Araneus ventricosus TaxID=182803 RepID=A0A4Y2TU06_ARAVE|nr:hypothetical protein AVEN_54530-1 [Araneus ventricosus]